MPAAGRVSPWRDSGESRESPESKDGPTARTPGPSARTPGPSLAFTEPRTDAGDPQSLTTPPDRVTQRDAYFRGVADAPPCLSDQKSSPVSPRRKRRSVEVRNSLRLFGLLTVLAGVNVYVFFFNHGTAPREVLKPSSMVKAAEGKTGILKQATAEANAALLPQAAMPGTTASGAESASKGKLPVALVSPSGSGAPSPKVISRSGVPGPLGEPVGKSSPLATGGGPPKGSPGGSPGQDPETRLAQAKDQATDQDTKTPSGLVENPRENPENSPEKRFSDSDTLGHVLAGEGFGPEGPRVVGALSRLFDPKLIRGGQAYLIRSDERGEPESFEYRPNAVTRFVVTRSDSGSWVAVRVDQPVETKVVAVAGTVDATLYESVQTAGEKRALAGLLVELLAWDVNFYTDTHPGDHWKVIVEKQFLGGQFYRYGHILAAEYGGRVGTFHSFYWKSARSGGEGRYFDEKGQAISKTMLKTPLRYVRISSKFDRHRFHPILHQERAHLGIDYAAPVGTPVWASSGGKVIECGMKRGSGNTVVIGHGNGMTTRYYHMCRFARGLKAGKMVRQKEVIGFVGTTGLSTGPHLHFSVTKNGAFVDPSKVQVNRDAPVADREAFLATVRPRLAALHALVPGALARN